MSSLQYSGPSSYYRNLAELPTPTSAKFLVSSSGCTAIRVGYSIRDHERNTKRSVTKTFTLTKPASGDVPSEPIISSIVTQDSPEIQATAISPSGKRRAILREVADQSGAKKRFVEVWIDSQLEALLEVTKRHGQFHTDGSYHITQQSRSSAQGRRTALIYTAEANPESADDVEDDPYPKFRFIPHFGETLHSRKRPTLYVLRWRSVNDDAFPSNPKAAKKDISLTALALEQPPAVPVVFGQAVFATETRLFATGYEQTADGRILGIKGCFNRPCGIWELTFGDKTSTKDSVMPVKAVIIETPGLSCRSPRILYDKDGIASKLLWLSNPLGGPHASTVSLHSRDLRGGSGDKVVIGAVSDPGPGEFPGLYTEYNLASIPFLQHRGTCVIAQSLWRSRQTLISIDMDTGKAVDETPALQGEPLYSWSLLATDGFGSVVCSRSTPTSPPEVVLLTFSEDGVSALVLDKPVVSAEVRRVLDGLVATIIPIPNRGPTETIVIQTKEHADGRKPICVTIPHGGPHATSTTAFTPSVLALALEGYTISLPNYTGSMGFGEKHIQALLGQCGTLDVGDCIATVEELIKLGISDRSRQVVQGGSHGGFLAAHLIGQYPDVFSAAVMRNPVISAGELCASDITDWPYAEFGLSFGPGTHVTPEIYAKLYGASPISYIDKVKTPVLLLIGEDDLRVPPTQGKGYYHALKGRHRVAEMLVFPKETHPIDGVEAARVAFEAGRDWFRVFSRSEDS
ncbi:Alpha/Beta hydrolase protein [Phlebopus sp. FC_14]|nr:Alpha/Beta hydrolase protein [Phlebopus sp. FC_14]